MSFASSAAAMEWGECWLPVEPVPPTLAAGLRRDFGAVPSWTGRLMAAPWLVRAVAGITKNAPAFIAPELHELVSLVVSQDNACRYCYGMTRTVLRVLGHDDAAIDRLETNLERADLPAADRAALLFARRISRADPRPGAAEMAGLRAAGFSREAVAEIAWAAAAAVFANRVATLFALPPEPVERWVASPIGRLARPVIAWFMRPRSAATVPLPAPNDGPCAGVVEALAGSPAAPRLRHAIDDALASPILPRRTKLLMLTVVAHALDCGRGAQEGRDGLAVEGLAPAVVDRIVRDLGGPELDAREALLLPFARESVRYRNAEIQRRTHALAERLPVADVVEAGGIAALANAVCRLSVLLDAC